MEERSGASVISVTRGRRVWGACAFVLAAASLSCTAHRGPLVVTDPDPSVKIPAMQKAVRNHDMSAVPQLIKDLDSDDAAVRLYANRSLEELTGQRFGYRYFGGDEEREAAAARWRQWYQEYLASQAKGKGPQALVQAGEGRS